MRLPNWIEYLGAMASESQRFLERTHLWWFIGHVLLAGGIGAVLVYFVSVQLGVTGGVLFLLIVWLVVTPSRVWKDQHERTSALEEQMRPTLRVTIDPERMSPGDIGIFLRLRVHNGGHATATGCYGKLREVRPRAPTDQRMPEPGQNLHWSTRGGCGGQRTCDVNAKSDEFLDVAFAGPSPRVKPTRFAFRIVEPWDWPIADGEYDVEIEVGASNIATPTTDSYRIVYRDALNLAWVS